MLAVIGDGYRGLIALADVVVDGADSRVVPLACVVPSLHDAVVARIGEPSAFSLRLSTDRMAPCRLPYRGS